MRPGPMFFKIVFIFVSLTFFIGCAATYTIDSNPANARIFIDGKKKREKLPTLILKKFGLEQVTTLH